MNDDIMTMGEVAAAFGVDPKTVRRWCIEGRIPHFRTLGGRRRFYREDVSRLMAKAGMNNG